MHTHPCHASTCLPNHASPCQAAPRIANQTCRAMPRLAPPRHVIPRRACRAEPFLAKPRHATPYQPYQTLRCHTTPCRAQPYLPYLSAPDLALPRRAKPAKPHRARPSPSLPCLPCVTSRAPLSPSRCRRAASSAGIAFSARSTGLARPPPRRREGPRASPRPPRADTGYRCLRRFGPRTD